MIIKKPTTSNSQKIWLERLKQKDVPSEQQIVEDNNSLADELLEDFLDSVADKYDD